MSPNYGFTITIRKISPRSYDPGDSLSGQAYERGKFRPRFTMKPRWHRGPGEEQDFIPVWETEAQAEAVVARLVAAGIGQRFTFQVSRIADGLRSGGPSCYSPFQGVDGWKVPPVERGPILSQWTPSRE